MNINMIRDKILSHAHKKHLFYYYGLRGQNEKFSGSIIKVYSRTFLIQTDKGVLKSFSFSDFATQLLKILE